MKDYVFSNVGALHFGMALLSSGMRVFWHSKHIKYKPVNADKWKIKKYVRF